ncbi:glycosyltransferase family 4 protein [Marilutibacter spongiae]|uniref:Glycosyltransferase family 4 protein n=1 Tax=Marilutibacter spongiae TaxID=2025720 RepID=A0A7W3Y5N9_9GAMM|nr:glycosyltransferase family 4 protein [Lysobacter spongiae]MBB1060613.1 glycosyltransferase family 4 protein [Lysobacter spongiae]
MTRLATHSPDRVPRVALLRSSAGLYGADRMVLTLNQALPQAGVASRLLSIGNPRMPVQALHEAAVAGGQQAELLACRGRLDLRTLHLLRAALRRQGATIVHVHDYKSATYAWLASLRLPVRLVATLHGHVDATRALRIYNRLELGLLRRFDALAVVSERQVDLLAGAGIARERIQLVDNGIPLRAEDLEAPPMSREALGLDAASFVFAAVARFSPEKNLLLLLDAFARVADGREDCQLLLVGDGPMGDAMRERCTALGIARHVRFAGVRDDMPSVYPRIDCLVLPSLSEGMPLTVLEAMSHGLPVIASAVGDVPRLLSGTDHGRLVPPGELGALVDSMRSRLQAGRAFDARARARVLSRHSPGAMANRYRAMYESLGGWAHGVQAA